jgi:hypothetical protein
MIPTTDSAEPLKPTIPVECNVKQFGVGGIGGATADYLALFLSAEANAHPDCDVTLTLIDGDVYEPRNAARMHFAEAGNKADVKRKELKDRLGAALQRLIISSIGQYVTPDNVGRLVSDGDFCICAVDNHATRKLLSDHFAEHVGDGVLISAGNDGVGDDGHGRVLRGTYGNCQVYIRREGRDVTPSLTQFHPEIADPADHLPTDLSCAELAASVPQILWSNLWAAALICSTFYLCLCGEQESRYAELAFDIAEGCVQPIRLPATGAAAAV